MENGIQGTSAEQEPTRGRRRERLNALLRLSPGALPGSSSWPVARASGSVDARARPIVRCLRRGWVI